MGFAAGKGGRYHVCGCTRMSPSPTPALWGALPVPATRSNAFRSLHPSCCCGCARTHICLLLFYSGFAMWVNGVRSPDLLLWGQIWGWGWSWHPPRSSGPMLSTCTGFLLGVLGWVFGPEVIEDLPQGEGERKARLSLIVIEAEV